jgi:hypothetical protein
MKRRPALHDGFSLVEVALALGIFVFGAVATIGLLPSGLGLSRAAVAETVAPGIAARFYTLLATQPFSAVKVPLYDPQGTLVRYLHHEGAPSATGLDLRTISQPLTFRANARGELLTEEADPLFLGTPSQPADTGGIYRVTVTFDPAPDHFERGFASKVTLRVAWQPYADNHRDFVRVVTGY